MQQGKTQNVWHPIKKNCQACKKPKLIKPISEGEKRDPEMTQIIEILLVQKDIVTVRHVSRR